MNTARKLLTIVMLTSLAGCSASVRVKLATDCIWFKDQTLSQESKDWLAGGMEWEEWAETWPSYMAKDFNEIANNNDLAKKNC
jgi:hypothetical protein